MRLRPIFGRVGTVVVLALAGVITSCGSPEEARHHRLEIRDMAFRPAELEVAVGDTITWTNHDIVSHTVTGDTWHSPGLGSGERYTIVVGESDATAYTCLYHPTMIGRLVTP